MPVRVRAWSGRKLLRSYAKIGDLSVDLEQIGNSAVWQATVQTGGLPDGISQLTVHFEDRYGKSGLRYHPNGHQPLVGTVETS